MEDNDITNITYQNSTLVAITKRGFIYLYSRVPLKVQNGLEGFYFNFKMRIRELKILGQKLGRIEDIHVFKGTDMYVLDEDTQLISFFKIINNREVNLISRSKYGYDLGLPRDTSQKKKKMVFDSEYKMVFVVDGEDVFHVPTDSFLSPDGHIGNVGFKPASS